LLECARNPPCAPRTVKRIDIMDTQAPDVALLFNASTTIGLEKSKRDEDVADEAELEQLADRVSAARSVY
jgi:hypothetical protein